MPLEELLFVESLGSPLTWHELAVAGQLDDAEFRCYLRLLQLRWASPNLSVLLANPMALQLLHAFFDTPAEGDHRVPAVDAAVPYRADLAIAWKRSEFAVAAERRIASATRPKP
jgi:hypothetical protein